MDTTIFFALLLSTIIPIFLLLTRQKSSSSKRLPPGSLGFPIIGHSLQLLQAMRSNTAEKWLQDRIKIYGPISKLSLFGTPTVFINGPAANKFLLTGDSHTLGNQQTQSMKMLLGDRNLFELGADDHKRVRSAIVQFLKPEMLKKYVLPLTKTLTFDIISSLLFGMDHGPLRSELIKGFQEMIEGMWSIPINLPFTTFNRSLRASKRVRTMVRNLIHEKRVALEQGQASSHQDLISYMLTNGRDNKEEKTTDEEIEDNCVIVMTAGYDTSSVLITFIMRFLANEPVICAHVVHEQEEIAKSKAPGEPLTWEDVAKMKYTWKVAQETLRMIPPAFGSFRRVLKDIEYGGYLIPKGWQLFFAMSSTHRDERFFPEPLKFDPAHFDSPASVPPYSFIPFGGGARICPGIEFARLETLIMIHYLVTQFTWKLCCKDDTFIRNPMPVPSQGLPIQLEPKKTS